MVYLLNMVDLSMANCECHNQMVFFLFFLFSSAHDHSLESQRAWAHPWCYEQCHWSRRCPGAMESQEKDTENPMDLLGQWSTNMFMYVFILWRNIHGDKWWLFHILLIWRGSLYNLPEPKPRSKQQFCTVFLCRLPYPILFHFIKLQSYLFFFKGWAIFHLFLHY